MNGGSTVERVSVCGPGCSVDGAGAATNGPRGRRAELGTARRRPVPPLCCRVRQEKPAAPRTRRPTGPDSAPRGADLLHGGQRRPVRFRKPARKPARGAEREPPACGAADAGTRGLARHASGGYGCPAMVEPYALSRTTLTLVLEAVPHRVERDAETGRFFAINDDLHTIAEGDTQAEADANFHEALVGLVDYCLESGLPLPKALVEHRTVVTA